MDIGEKLKYLSTNEKNIIFESLPNGLCVKSLDADISKRLFAKKYGFKSGINLLFGGNGQGKTSLMYILDFIIGDYRERKDDICHSCSITVSNKGFRVFSFSNSEHNMAVSKREVATAYDLFEHMSAKERSEGQNVLHTVEEFLRVLEDDSKAPPNINICAFMDEADSGLDPIACKHLVRRIKRLCNRKHNIQLFISFNQYEMSKLDKTMLNVCTGEFEPTPKTYGEHIERLNKNKKEFKRK